MNGTLIVCHVLPGCRMKSDIESNVDDVLTRDFHSPVLNHMILLNFQL